MRAAATGSVSLVLGHAFVIRVWTLTSRWTYRVWNTEASSGSTGSCCVRVAVSLSCHRKLTRDMELLRPWLLTLLPLLQVLKAQSEGHPQGCLEICMMVCFPCLRSLKLHPGLTFVGFCVFFQEHMLTHQAGPSLSSQKPRVFKCDTCEKAFAKPSQLERHSRIHTGTETG